MTRIEPSSSRDISMDRTAKILREAAGLLRGPQRIVPLALKLGSDALGTKIEPRTLYTYAATSQPTENALRSVMGWILRARRRHGGIAAFYSLLSGYSEPYPEVTGYLIPTLYDFAHHRADEAASRAAEQAARWLLSLQMPSGAFPGGLHGLAGGPSIFNTGQILLGLVRAFRETKDATLLERAVAAGDWLAQIQQPDGSWSGAGAYQGVSHTYYSMVAWSLAELAATGGGAEHAAAAERNLDWVLSQVKPGGWIDGINLQGYPFFLHFIAYILQGVLETGLLLRRKDALESVAHSSWVLLRKFEIGKRLAGAYQPGFGGGMKFACLTGNAQMSCVWLRLFEACYDQRYLNAALKMNEMLKQRLTVRGPGGVVGGVAGSYPAWGAYQPLRYISWGAKFLADALMLELRALHSLEAACAS